MKQRRGRRDRSTSGTRRGSPSLRRCTVPDFRTGPASTVKQFYRNVEAGNIDDAIKLLSPSHARRGSDRLHAQIFLPKPLICAHLLCGLAVSEQTLRSRLRERGLLVSNDVGRQMLTVRRTLEGSPRQVLHLASDLVGLGAEIGPVDHGGG